MALTQTQKELARIVIEYNGGKAVEQARFGALSDADALAEIEAFKEKRITELSSYLSFHQLEITKLQSELDLLNNYTGE